MEIIFIAYASLVGFLNMAAGRKFFGLINSTQLGRILFAVGSALPLILFNEPLFVALIAVALYLWRLPAWDFAAINGKMKMELWQNKLARKIWSIEPKNQMEWRLLGTLGMAIRMALIIPAVLLAGQFLHWIAFPLMGIAYFAMGFLGENRAVERAEFVSGVIIGLMLVGI